MAKKGKPGTAKSVPQTPKSSTKIKQGGGQ